MSRPLLPGLPVLGMVPSVHSPRSTGARRAGGQRAAVRAWAAASGCPLVETVKLVGQHVLGGHANPDGMHWRCAAHAAGTAVAEALRAAL